MSGTMQDSGLLARIMERTAPSPLGCILWLGALDCGYGRVFVDSRAARVHRVVWELEHGPVPAGLTLDHTCRIRSCVNTDHLEAVSQTVNTRRAIPYRPARRRVARVRVTAKQAPVVKPEAPKRVTVTGFIGPGIGKGGVQRFKTHCPYQHEYTPENTYILPGTGGRVCRTCQNRRRREYTERLRSQTAARPRQGGGASGP